ICANQAENAKYRLKIFQTVFAVFNCRFSSVSGFLFGAEADWQSDCNQRMKASRQKQSYPLYRPDI
ncbi:TPA: hypothetical protein ACJJGP_002080, partial [Neisseria meningitidis]